MPFQTSIQTCKCSEGIKDSNNRWNRCFTEHKLHADCQKGRKMLFFVPGDLDLDLQTRPSEGPNMSSMWIWCKTVQQFQRCFMQKQKATDWRRQKQNLPQFTACSNKALHRNTSQACRASDFTRLNRSATRFGLRSFTRSAIASI